MKLVVLHTDYGKKRYFQFYLMNNGKCLDAKWSKQFSTKDDDNTINEIVKYLPTDEKECNGQ